MINECPDQCYIDRVEVRGDGRYPADGCVVVLIPIQQEDSRSSIRETPVYRGPKDKADQCAIRLRRALMTLPKLAAAS